MGPRYFTAVALASLTLMAAACGGSDGGGGTPNAPSGGSPGTVAATITIDADGVASPRDVTVPAGSRVTMVNNHSRPHEMASNPHPEHSQCPALNQWGLLQPNQSRTSGNLNAPGTCGFHDHLNEANTSLQGTIRIQ